MIIALTKVAEKMLKLEESQTLMGFEPMTSKE